MSTSELDSRNIAISMRKSVENLVISSQDAIGQSISQALTFSGGFAQHTAQILPDSKSVSRSPSPSPRSSEVGADILDNDKDFCPGNLIEEALLQGSEMAIHVPSLVGDNVSVCSEAAVSLRGDVAKAPTPTPRGGEARSKKKSWYNSLYPTYKSKSDDFKRLFKDLPDEERLIVDYSCALQKDILAHGRLYASQNYLCFYASIFGWETSLSLRWKDVTAITKEKTALVIPNAILVCTESEKNFLTSFSGRDKAYLMLFRVWQNALMDQPKTSHEIWQWVHSCYGEELGFNSDDEGYARDLPIDAPVPPPDTPTEDLVDAMSMDAGGGGEGRGEGRSSQPRDGSPPLVNNGETEYRASEAGDALPTDMSETSDSEPEKHHNSAEPTACTSPHGGKLIMRQQFPFNIDQLFTMIFTNSKFNLELLAARGTTDYVQAPWQPQGGLKCRQVNYVLRLTTGPIGPKEVNVTEVQVMNKCSKPGVLYSIEATSENSGIPYADYFAVEAHYCLRRVHAHLTDFHFYGQVKYKKNMWPMVKAFLEKNTMSGLEDYARLIETRLAAEAEVAAPTARKGRRHRRVTTSSQETTATATVKSPAAAILVPRAALPAPRGSAWLPASLLLLLAINALLYWRLYHVDRKPFDMDDLQQRMSAATDAQKVDWSRLLASYTLHQRGELGDWRDAIDVAIGHLAQTEKALRKLLEAIEPSLEKARHDANTQGKDTARGTDAGGTGAGDAGHTEQRDEL